MKAKVDEDRRRGHGVRWSLCPEVFDLTDDGYAVVLTPEVPVESEDDRTVAVPAALQDLGPCVTARTAALPCAIDPADARP
ncbi:ferredoxin [Streptomyces sp. NPDC059697]|uniref:ferredoxin n=1 Tax=Streptomyces sp. NPDC059697 TaxID=3346912 RepID=UPI0036752E28